MRQPSYITLDGDMVDLIAFRHYGRTSGATEAVFEANRHLAGHGAALPAGLTLVLPGLTATTKAPVRLWS